MNKVLITLFILINLYCFAVVALNKNLVENGAYGILKNTLHRISELRIDTYSDFKLFYHKTSAGKTYLRRSIGILIGQILIFRVCLFSLFNLCKKQEKKQQSQNRFG